MLMLYIFLISLIIFFIIHLFLQRIFINNLIYNFLIALLINNTLLFIYLYKIEISIVYRILLFLNIFLSQFVYLIIIQAIRSSIQIYIIQSYKKLNVKNLFKEDLKIFEKRIKSLSANNIVYRKKNILIYNSKVGLNLVLYIFQIFKKIYNEKF